MLNHCLKIHNTCLSIDIEYKLNLEQKLYAHNSPQDSQATLQK